MAIVKKLNSELTIADSLVEEYLEMGYSLLDEKGNVVRKNKTTAEVVAELEKENTALKNEIVSLKEEINALTQSHNASNEVSEDVNTSSTPKSKRANKGE